MSGRRKTIAVAAACTAAGALGGIAGAAAAPAAHRSNAEGHSAAQSGTPGLGGPHMGAGPAVHEDAVVLDKAGTGFITATEDNGTVVSVIGDQLQISEAIGKVTYKTVTLTIPAGATVVRNFKTATLTDLKPGDHVHVTESSDGTSVFADDGTGGPPMGGRGPGHPGGFGPPRGPSGGWPGPPSGPGGPGSTTTSTTTTTTS